MKPIRIPHRGLAAALLLAVAVPAHATNGMYLAGYGSEAAGRGGANVAVADRSLGLQANPAGLAQLMGQHFGIDVQLLAPSLRYSGDPLGNRLDAENALFTMPSLSYVRGPAKSKWAVGLGLISQGGMGAQFEGYRTPFGTTDGTFSEVRFLTATPTLAYAVTPDLAIGVSGNLGYSDVTFRFYPNTSFYDDGGTPMDPSDDMAFFGANLSKRARAFNTSARAGVMWTALEQLQLGAVYQTRTRGDYENGTLGFNMSSLGLGEVKYDAVMDGFTWPDQIGLGLQVRPAERWRLAVDARRYLWSGAVKLIEVRGTNPDQAVPSMLSTMRMPFVFEWTDEWAWIVGAEYRALDALTLRGGYNFGRSPVPDATLNPLFPATTEQHATLGAGWTWAGSTLNFAVERAFEARQVNRNTDPNVNPFGPGAEVDHSQWTFSLGFSRALSSK